jgi:hypothetical protein
MQDNLELQGLGLLSGALQLPQSSVLLVDETLMNEGTLVEKGTLKQTTFMNSS